MAHTRQSRPDHGLGYQVKVLWPWLAGEGLSSLVAPPRVDDLGPGNARLGGVEQRGLESSFTDPRRLQPHTRPVFT